MEAPLPGGLEKQMKVNPLRMLAVLCLVAAGVGITVILAKQNNGAQRDFIEYWAAEQQIVYGGNPYSQAAIYKLERSTGQRRDKAELFQSSCRLSPCSAARLRECRSWQRDLDADACRQPHGFHSHSLASLTDAHPTAYTCSAIALRP